MRAITLINTIYKHAVEAMRSDIDMDYKDFASHMDDVMEYALFDIECLGRGIVIPPRKWPNGYCCPRAFQNFDFSKFWNDVATAVHRATTRKQRKQLKMQWRKRGI